MFAIKFTNRDESCGGASAPYIETVYHAYAFSVIRSPGFTSVCMALKPDVLPYEYDPGAVNIEVAGPVFVMNDDGKTIDRIAKSEPVPEVQSAR